MAKWKVTSDCNWGFSLFNRGPRILFNGIRPGHFLTGVTRSCLMAFLIWAFEIDWYIDLLAKLQVYMNLESILDVIAFVGESLSISISVFERVRGFAPCGIHLLSDKFMCAPPPPLTENRITVHVFH